MTHTPADKNPKVILTLVFVFLAGGVTGALSMRIGLHDKLHRTVSAAGLAPGAVIPSATTRIPSAASPADDAVLQRFKKELNLTPDQTEKMSIVLNDYRNYFESLREQLDDVRATGKMRILEILNEDQRKKFEKMSTDLVPPPPPPPVRK